MLNLYSFDTGSITTPNAAAGYTIFPDDVYLKLFLESKLLYPLTLYRNSSSSGGSD